MIKNISKFFNLTLHEFSELNYSNENKDIEYFNSADDEENSFQKIGLVHQDGYYIFGLIIGNNFHPVPLHQLEKINMYYLRKNIISFIIDSKPIEEISKKFIGYITLEEYKKSINK